MWLSSLVERLSVVAPVLLPVLIDAAIKGAVILALTALAALALRRSSAATRHLSWFLGTLGLLVLPILSATLPHLELLPRWATSIPVSSAPAPTAPAPVNAPLTVSSSGAPLSPDDVPPNTPATIDLAPPVPAVPASSPVLAPSPIRLTWQSCVVLAWLAGVVLLLGHVLLGFLSLSWLRHRSHPISDGPWLILLRQLCEELGLRRPVELLASDRRSMPMTWGLSRTHVLLPEESATWPPDQRRAVLLHELAHARRWDCLMQLVTQLACALHWFNPLAWLAARQMKAEREQACDDLVLNAGAKASAYAEQLLHIASDMPAPRLTAAAIAMARPGRLEGRLLAILDMTRNRRAVGRLGLLAGVLVLLAVALPVAMLRGEQEKPPATAPAEATFGPVIERELWNGPGSKSAMIDLDTGKLFGPPPGEGFLVLGARLREPGALTRTAKWAAERGIDAFALDGLQGFRLAFDGYDDGVKAWESVSAQRVREIMTEQDGATPAHLSAGLAAVEREGQVPKPATYLFKTREGGMGVLQILRYSDEPEGARAKIRYKLVQEPGPRPPAPAPAATQPASRLQVRPVLNDSEKGAFDEMADPDDPKRMLRVGRDVVVDDSAVAGASVAIGGDSRLIVLRLKPAGERAFMEAMSMGRLAILLDGKVVSAREQGLNGTLMFPAGQDRQATRALLDYFDKNSQTSAPRIGGSARPGAFASTTRPSFAPAPTTRPLSGRFPPMAPPTLGEGTTCALDGTIYELRLPPDQIGRIDLPALAKAAATPAAFEKALADLGASKPLYRANQAVRLAGDSITMGAQTPIVTNTRKAADGRPINTYTYVSTGAIFHVAGQPRAAGHVELDLSIQVAAVGEAAAAGAPSPPIRMATLVHKSPVTAGQPFVVVSVDAASLDPAGKAVAYIARITLGPPQSSTTRPAGSGS